jgi:hypothetical protein
MVEFDFDPDPRTWQYPRILAVVLLVCVSVSMLVGGTIASSDYSLFNSGWDGSSEIRDLAIDMNKQPAVVIDPARYDTLEAETTTAIILSPETRYSQADENYLRSFLQQGGTVVIADDFRGHSNQLLAGINATARIDGRLLRDQYSNTESPAFPKATNVSDDPLTEEVTALSLNHPSVVNPANASVLVRSSNYTYLDENFNERLDENESVRSYPIVTEESVANGTVVTVSDPSMFINAMSEDSGNTVFIQNIITQDATIALDYSHNSGRAPLSVALIYLRRSSELQAGLGIMLLLVTLGTRRYTRDYDS